MGRVSFEGRVGLITGASRGIGHAVAEEIVARGGRVTITGRDADALSAAVTSLGGSAVALGIVGKAALGKVFEVNVLAAVEWIRMVHEAWMGEHGDPLSPCRR